MPELRNRVVAALGDSYELDGELGRGGMAVVYRATDTRLRRAVAIKVLPPDLAFNADVRERFLREAQTAAQLTHPNIVPIFTVDERNGVVFFVMGLVDGETLATRLRRDRVLTPGDATRMLIEVADALAYAHGRGVVHRDIKPDNVLIDRATGRALVTDFGIARAAAEDSRLTVTGIAVGTPAFMSPEQAMGERELDGRSDVYSLGVVGYQMLCGEPPFRAANTPAMLLKHLVEPPPPLRDRAPHVPEPVAAAIHRALAKTPEDRWANAGAFRDALVRGDARMPAAPPARVVPAVPRPAPGLGGNDQWWPPAPVLPELPPLDPRPRSSRDPADDPRIVERIGEFRRRFLGWTALSGFLVFINAMTNTPPWSIFPIFGLGLGLMRRWTPLGRVGLRFWDVILEGEDAIILARNRRDGSRLQRLVDGFRRRLKLTVVYGLLSAAVYAVGATFGYDPLIPVFVGSVLGAVGSALGTLINAVRLKRSGVGFLELLSSAWDPGERLSSPLDAPERARALRPPVADVVVQLAGRDVAGSAWGASVRRAVVARIAIRDIVDELDPADRALIPDVLPTVESLVQRVATLAGTVYRVRRDSGAESVARLDARLAALNGQPDDGRRERTRTLLERQRSSLLDLVQRGDQLEQQLESAVLMLETLRLDLAKLRSSGLAAAADDVSSATQEARALSRELGYALSGVREARDP